MATRRSDVVRKGVSTTYHCYSRCVRRAYLLGDDPLTGRCFEHRRDWFMRRLALLADVFAIDVNFFSVLSNHFHLVLRTSPRRVAKMDRKEVARRWLKAYPGSRILGDETPEPNEEQVERLAADKQRIAKIRKRLSDVSWFMAALKEHIARRANREDDCKGAFWEQRFGCRAVYGEHGMLTIGLYTDLNLVRAGEAASPMQTPYCSAGLRFKSAQAGDPVPWLSELSLAEGQDPEGEAANGKRATDRGVLEMPREEYERILGWLSLQEGPLRQQGVPPDLRSKFESRQIDWEQFVELLDDLPGAFPRVLGEATAVRSHAEQVGKRWFHGVRRAARVFAS